MLFRSWRRQWADRSVRAVLSGLVNDVDYAERFGDDGFEALVHVDNTTIPFPTTEIVDGKNLEFTALTWGFSNLWLGAGWCLPLPPGEFDNDLHVDNEERGRTVVACQLRRPLGALWDSEIARTAL